MTPARRADTVNVTFEVSEPAAVFYTLDGSRPTYASTLYASAGIREGAEVLTLPVGTRIHWFSVDTAGNVENNYRPDGRRRTTTRGSRSCRDTDRAIRSGNTAPVRYRISRSWFP